VFDYELDLGLGYAYTVFGVRVQVDGPGQTITELLTLYAYSEFNKTYKHPEDPDPEQFSMKVSVLPDSPSSKLTVRITKMQEAPFSVKVVADLVVGSTSEAIQGRPNE
jgi:hypothetical protein